MNAIETFDVTHKYSDKVVISIPNISLAVGKPLLVLGKSGVGKSTLLHILGGLLRPTHGTVSVKGQKLVDLNSSALDKFRGEHIGIVFQNHHFIQSLSVAENVALAQYLPGKKTDKSKVLDILQRLGIDHRKDASTETLSNGEKQRLSIARALINQPTIILADEPTSALDDENCMLVIDLLLTNAAQTNSTPIIVTHDYRLKSIIDNQIEL